jgi:hypothetical protein
MAQMLRQKTEDHGDLLLNSERGCRVAKQVADTKTARQLLELAAEHLTRKTTARQGRLTGVM